MTNDNHDCRQGIARSKVPHKHESIFMKRAKYTMSSQRFGKRKKINFFIHKLHLV